MYFKRHHFSSLSSTNDYAKELFVDGATTPFLVIADEQTKGRGQMNKKWEKEDFNNLSVTFGFRPNLNQKNSFLLNTIASLACTDALAKINIDASIKWPNDILIEDKKLGGILIENRIHKEQISSSAIGIGINVNSAPKLNISERQATYVNEHINESLESMFVLEQLEKTFLNRVEQLKNPQILYSDYVQKLYRMDAISRFFNIEKQKDCKLFIRGIQKNGQLVTETEDGILQQFSFGEIKLLD